MQFRQCKDVALSEIDSDLMQLYEAYLHGKGAVRNSSSFYMRIFGPYITEHWKRID